MHDLTGVQRDLLSVVAGMDDPHGLAVTREFESATDERISHGGIYPNLDELVETGLAAKRRVDERTNAHALTDRGERELAARREWEDEFLAETVSP